MYKTSEQSKLSHSSSSLAAGNEKLKKKKRLCFKEPEVDTPQSSSWSNSNRMQPKPSALLAPNNGPKHSISLEDLTLEDQTFLIAKQVGQAFDKKPCERRQLAIPGISKTSCTDFRPVRPNSGFLKETLQNDCSHGVVNALRKNGSNSRMTLASTDVHNFGDALSPPVLNMATMKFPAIEVGPSTSTKPSQALVAATDVISTSFQHQLQFLKYQAEQQRQQIQAAFAHIELLKNQLQAETSARYKAQAQNHQLIMQNKELLDHVQNLYKQIQDLEKLLEKQVHKPSFPSSLPQRSKDEELATEPATACVMVTPPKKNGDKQQTRSSAFAPNSVMANRRSSLTGLKPFPTKTSYLEPSNKRGEVPLSSSRGSSPTPTDQIKSPLPQEGDASGTGMNNSNGGRSFLFNNTKRDNGVKGVPTKEQHEIAEDSSTRDWSKTSGYRQGSSIPTSKLTTDTARSNLKSFRTTESNFHDQKLVLNENPFFIEEKSPRKSEGYTSKKNHSSVQPADYMTVSSVSFSPKQHTNWSKTSNFNNDGALQLASDSTPNFYVKENRRLASGASRLFNS